MFAKLSISQKIYAGFALMVAIIATIIGASYRGFSAMREASDWNVHTYEVLNQIDDILGSVINIETGMRGFVITGKSTFLAPLESGQQALAKRTQTLIELTADNPRQQARIADLRRLQGAWLQEDIEPLLAQRRALNQAVLPDEALAGIRRRWTTCVLYWLPCEKRRAIYLSSVTRRWTTATAT